MSFNAIMRWGSCVVAAISVLAGASCLRANAATEIHAACGAAITDPLPIRLSVLPLQAVHKNSASCAAHRASSVIVAQVTSCEVDPTDPSCVCQEGETDNDCLDGVHRG